jgi:hypothetical protein
MAKKSDEAQAAEETRIELGSFTAKAINEDGAEARLSDERHQSSVLSRFRTTNRLFERGAVYSLFAVKTAGPPEPPTVTATLPAEDAGSLPSTAEIHKPGEQPEA